MTPSVHCLAPSYDEAQRFERSLVCDSAIPAAALSGLEAVVLQRQTAERARGLLARGARRVLLGDAALIDPDLVGRLAREYAPERVGLYIAARRKPNRWSFDTTSNADFKTVTPSVCEPAWGVLRSDGTATELNAYHWAAAMVRAGATSALVQVDLADDDDLNICAGFVELLGERVCFAPATQTAPALYDWVAFGQARSIALPPLVYARRKALLTPPPERARAA